MTALSAPLGSPRKNFHPASAASSCLGELAFAAHERDRRKSIASVATMAIRVRDAEFHEDLFLVAAFAGFRAFGGFRRGGVLGGAQSQQEYANGFAEQAVDGLSVFQLDFASQRSEPALRPDDRVDHGVHREIRIEIGTERAVGNALADQFGETLETAADESAIPGR